MIAFINVALGLTNLLPIPALDGGRIFFVLIEAVRGRRIEPEREGMVHVIGMLVLLGLMVLLVVQDIVNPIIPF
jgi:regulator of sigma E protease